MELETEHLLTVCSPMDACIISAVGLYGTEPVVVTADGDMQLSLHRPFCETRETSWPSPHTRAAEQLSLSPCPPLQLASASLDALLLWHLEPCLPLPPDGSPPCHVFDIPPLSSVGCVCFSPSAQHLVLCDGTAVLVWRTESGQLENTLRGHSSPITHVTFHPHHSHTLITTSQDRTFKIWDVEEGCAIYQSPIMSSVPLTCAAVDGNEETLAIGAADGKLWLLDLSPAGGHRCLLQCQVWRERDRYLSTTRGEERGGEERGGEEEAGSEAEAGTTLLKLHFCTNSPREKSLDCSEALIGKLDGLLAVGHTAIVTFDPKTLEATAFLDFRDPIASSVCPPSCSLPIASTCAMITSLSDNQVYCVLGGMFEMVVSLLALSACTSPTTRDGGLRDEVLSVLSSTPLGANSPLRSEFTLKPHPSSSTTKKKPGVNKARSGIVDKPLTFKTRVSSSGYASSPRMKMFTPSVAAATNCKRLPKPSSSSAHHPERGCVCKQQTYPMEGGAPTSFHSTLQPLDRPCPLSCLSFSGEGHYMCCGGADKAAYLLKMPPSQRKIQALVGHDGPVHSVDWSHSGEWVLTGSADRTVRLWTPAHNDPLLTISAVKASTRLKSGLESKAGGQVQFPGAISHAIFYYLDKFILLSSSNSLYLYKYHIDPHPTDDIKRYRSLSHYKLVQPLCVEGMQTITAVDCINDFLSHLVLVGGSNKSVDVFDMNVMKKVWSMADCHTRPPHCVSLNKGSRAVSHPGWSYDLFLTAAPLDGVKLWDLRSNRCVRCLSAHVNRCHSVQARFSPCSRYIATGSEDKAAYVYDLRSLSPLHKLSGHSDTVTSLSFHPLKPMLATGTLDGKVTFFTSEGR